MTIRRSLAAAVFIAMSVSVAAETDPSSSPLRFDVVSIKRNVSGDSSVANQFLPNGEVRIQNTPVLGLIQRAYPGDNGRRQFVGLPSWVESERYDVIAKGKAGATVEQLRRMWRALLADRFKLVTHLEPREVPSYDLVLTQADGKLGSGLTRSTLDCTRPVSASATATQASGIDPAIGVMSKCAAFAFGPDQTVYGGGVTMQALATFVSPIAGRPVVDRTGLAGFYAVKVRFQRFPQPADAAPRPDDPPSVFTAFAEQLGLKFESSKTTVQALAVDHIERPDPD